MAQKPVTKKVAGAKPDPNSAIKQAIASQRAKVGKDPVPDSVRQKIVDSENPRDYLRRPDDETNGQRWAREAYDKDTKKANAATVDQLSSKQVLDNAAAAKKSGGIPAKKQKNP